MTTRDAAEFKRPLPAPTPLSQPFWDGTRRGEFLLQHCTQCDQWVWTPQEACRFCLNESLEWKQASGRGTVYSYVVIHRPATPAFQAPYVIALIDLEEGPTMLSDIINVDPKDVSIGMPVEASIEQYEGFGFYHFRPR